jgi:hypothetical protein
VIACPLPHCFRRLSAHASWELRGSECKPANPTVQGTTNDTVNLNAIIANNTLLGTDPKLANVGTKDFYPLAGSPVLGGGTPGPLGYPAYTVDGFEQPSPPNIGALAVRP